MNWLDFFFAAIMGLVYAAIVVSVIARRRDVVWPGLWFHWAILTLGMWAARLWLEPQVWPGYGWHLVLMAGLGLVLTLGLMALVPAGAGHSGVRPQPTADGSVPDNDLVLTAESGQVAPEVAMSTRTVIIWVLAVAVAGAAVAGVIVAGLTPPGS